MGNQLGIPLQGNVFRPSDGHHQVITRRPLSRILAFLNVTIDQICNDPITRNRVANYYRLYRDIVRDADAAELERQWSGAASYAKRAR